MTTSLSGDFPSALPAGLLLLLWFYTVWQRYVIEGTRARLAGLREVWRETLALNPAWRICAAAHIVDSMLDSSSERLPRCSLAFLLGAVLVPSQERALARARVYERLTRLPSSRLQEEAVSIVETAVRYVALAALKRSLLAWALAPLWLAAFIAWSLHWQLRVAVDGAPQAELRRARLRLRRSLLVPLVGVVTAVRAS